MLLEWPDLRRAIIWGHSHNDYCVKEMQCRIPKKCYESRGLVTSQHMHRWLAVHDDNTHGALQYGRPPLMLIVYGMRKRKHSCETASCLFLYFGVQSFCQAA